MSERKTNIVIVEDDRDFQNDPSVIEIKKHFENIIFKENATDALSYIKDNLKTKIIVVLDLAFPANQMQGIKFLEELRSLSKLIPVIIFSAKNNINGSEYQKMINDTIFAFLSKSVSSAEIVQKLCEADDYLNSQVDTAVEKWLENHTEEEKNKTFLTSADGKAYSMNDLLKEIRIQTQFGQSITMNINKLTLELLFRNKEKI